MATQNDFLPFATGPGANVVDQATYAALGALTTGFLSGTAQSVQLNKVWRQSSIMAAVIAQFIVAQTGQAAVDDGTTATLLANFTKAVNAASKQRVILPDSGSVNAYAAANPVPMTSLPTVGGIVQTISVKTTNTGASTYSPDGLPSRPIYGLGGGALQGGELVANGIATLVSYVGPLLNGGSLCWVLFECIGGAQQVAPATQSQHALQAGQALGLFLGVQVFTASGTYTPGTYVVGGRSITASKARVRAVGAGGAGGGSNSTGSTTSSAGSGGCAGAYGELVILSGLTSQPVTIGAGGTGNNAGTGNAGGSTSFGSLMVCQGGSGGIANSSIAPPFMTYAATTNPATVTGTGNIVLKIPGGIGAKSVMISTTIGYSGEGAPSVWGAGGPAAQGAGSSGYGFGGGGSGSLSSGGTSSLSGGTGNNGYLLVEEYA
ncbi:hypothetical protein [Burkholderia multivorans]|uniref:hypothetical protein n=1 Tax=Burkholderia multivorans TaxID=87883 RepID=UPI0021591F3B|nr:hypothetical protein [Burkholderia multivorans]